ncbi:MAG TPA: RNA-binding domain-containing protein [Gammaproteobacteria bacterium]|nr:RNA-binding domain-containing protein [Gammaproteobacteria bacterium]
MIEAFESKVLEFKSKLPHFSSLIKTCVAFANGLGGKIMVGIDDKTRQVLGVDEATRKRLYDEFPNSLYDSTSPGLLPEIYEKRIDDKSVVIIEVFGGNKKPVFVTSEGSVDGVYLRAGANTRKANREAVEALMRENKRIHYDEEAVHAGVDILNPSLLDALLGKHDQSRLMSEKIITRLSANSSRVAPTIAGVLMFSEAPENYIPEALVYCTRFRGVEGRDIIQTEAITGHLLKQADLSYQLVRSWLMREPRLFGTVMKGESMVPEVALREVIVNALVHRKYWISGAVKIALYDDRLEVFSPGNFPGLLDVNTLGDGTTYLRNPHLAHLARRAGLVEKLGTGIRMIFESCDKVNLIRPVFIEGADSVKVVFKFLPGKGKLMMDQEDLLALFNLKSEITLNDVASILNVSRNTATRRLNQLIADGKIERVGRGPAVRFVLLTR